MPYLESEGTSICLVVGVMTPAHGIVPLQHIFLILMISRQGVRMTVARVTISRRDTADTANVTALLSRIALQSFSLSPGIEVGLM